MKDLIDHYVQNDSQVLVWDIRQLLYQIEFCKTNNFVSLKNECDSLTDVNYRIESIGNGMTRFYLFHANEFELRTMYQLFNLSIEYGKGYLKNLTNRLIEAETSLPIKKQELIQYIQNGCSNLNKKNMCKKFPDFHYYFMKEEFAYFYPIILQINQYLEIHDTAIICIDGMCGSGKSTLSSVLKDVYCCHVFHMDDFFLQPYQRTAKRYEQPGENVDHERFKEEVLLPLTTQQTVYYRKFDCLTMEILDEVEAYPYKKINVIEGSYSMHPDLIDYYDIKIVLKIETSLQIDRILKRNGEKGLEMFKEKWIPLENKYFQAFDIFKKGDILFEITK